VRSRAETAQRWGSILVGAAVVVVVTWMTVEASGPPHGVRRDARDAGAPSISTSAPTATLAAATIDAGVAATDSLDSGLALSTSFDLGDAGPLMPSHAPKQIRLGVVLVTFAGAEGAPPNARSKREALEIAERLSRDARSDFHHAVSGGDPGSSEDIGRIPRGVLDPRTEISVFALESGAISDVLETPRGYWIAKRID
jgi:hypothetical protein